VLLICGKTSCTPDVTSLTIANAAVSLVTGVADTTVRAFLVCALRVHIAILRTKVALIDICNMNEELYAYLHKHYSQRCLGAVSKRAPIICCDGGKSLVI